MFRSLFIAAILCVVCSPVSLCIRSACAVDVTVTKTDGTQLAGRLRSIGEKQLTLDDKTTLNFNEIQNVKFTSAKDETKPSHRLALIDGSIVNVDDVETAKNVFTARFLGGKLKFSRRNVDWILLQANSQPETTVAKWNEVRNRKLETGDRLVVLRKGNIDWLDGVIGDMSADKVQFTLGERRASVGREKIAGMIFYHASGRELADSICSVLTIEGSQFNVRSIKVENDHLLLTMVSGDEQQIPFEKIDKLNFAEGRFAFLSDITPTSIRWTPLISSQSSLEYLKMLNQPRFNKSFRGDDLKLTMRKKLDNGLTAEKVAAYSKGWSARSGTRIVFAMGRKYKTLSGVVGFPDSAGKHGNLKLVIRGDGRILYETVMEAANLEHVKIDMDIKDVDRLIFEVQHHDGRTVGDELNFCDMKVNK